MQISVADVGKFVSGCVSVLDARFMLDNTPVSLEDFKTQSGLLPMVLWHADRLTEFALSKGMNLSIRENKAALLGYEVSSVTNVSVSKHYPIILEGIIQMTETLPKNDLGFVALDDMAKLFVQESANEAPHPGSKRTTR